MANEITLPVKVQIENLQNIAKEMHSQLGTLKVDSTGYKKLDNIILNIEKRIQQLQVISSRPFIDAKQFTAVQKEILGIEDDLTKIRIEAGKVKFSDLSLDASQQAKLQSFNAEIKSINDQLKQVKDSAKNTFFETDIGKAWKLDHAEDAGKTFAQITKIIETEVAKQEKALDDAKKAQQDYQDRLAARRQLTSFIKSGHELNKTNLGEELYNKIFDKNSNFKNGGRRLLTDWLQEQFKLDPSVAENLTKEAGKKVQAAFAQAKSEVEKTLRQERSRIDAGIKTEQAATSGGATYATEITEATTKLDASRAAKEAINQTNIKLSKTEEDLAEKLQKAKADRDAYTAALTRAAAGQLSMGASCDAARSQLETLNSVVDTGKAKLASLDQATGKLQGISNFVNRYVGAYAIIRKVTTAIRNAFSNIKDLDKVITSIAVVTNMSQEDLWNKVGQYTQMAQEYGVATKDVYSVSQLFYQQGLQTSQVMSLTTETLKMAKIAGMEYTQATNAMTVAVRAFKIEMDQAQQVTDTYSALAAKFAVSSAEIANAMEKTASSAASVGMSLQSTSAFISVMEQTTRESAQNIGSALKSIISRYGEMKASPTKLLNVDGEEVAFNKVDTALKSVGISIKDASGQFRNFDDVIMELASKWDSLDNNTQRYIATIMAGNRQQSRFIALVSNYDELNRAIQTADNAENASIVQVAKTMDSLESKANQLKNAFSQIYLDLHVESGLKNVYDWLTRILQTVSKLGVLKGVIPTLMNIVGFGTGMKGLLKSGMDFLQNQKGKWTVETQEAEDAIKRVRDQASQDIIAKYKLQADLSDLEAQKATLEAQRTIAETSRATASQRAYDIYKNSLSPNTTGLTQDEFEKKLSNPNDLQKELYNHSINGQAQKDIEEQATKYQEAGNAIQNLTSNLNGLSQTIDGLKQAQEGQKQTTDQLSQAQQQAAQSTQEVVTADQTKTSSAVETAQANYDAAVAARDNAQAALINARNTHVHTSAVVQDARAVLFKAEKDKEAALKALERAQADEQGAQSDEREARMSDYAADADKREGDASNNKAKGGGWAGHETAMKVAGIATSAARLLGTAITAFGAAHEDKSTDTGMFGQKMEYSKFYTGIGNGLSSAGMGASMGMALGPLGAAIGAIGGFLLGGLSTIIDGATMTLEEQLALEKEEAKKAADEALKSQAKVTDLETGLDNLKKLKEVMYNSVEDMQAYKDAMATMSNSYPELISSYDEAGNAIIDLQQAEITLAQTRAQASQEANKAAKAEAQVRKTTIDTLEQAQQQVTHVRPEAYRTYLDAAGNHHAFEDKGQWGLIIADLIDAFGEDVKSWNLNQIIQGLNKYNGSGSWNYIEMWRNILSENITENSDGSLTLAENFEADVRNLKEIKEANEILKNRASDLHISAASGVEDDLSYVYGFMNWDETIKLTAERVYEFEERLAQRIDSYKSQVAILDSTLPMTDAQESLDYALLSEEVGKASKISTSKVAAKLIANTLENAATSLHNISAGEWSRTEDPELANEYENTKSEATKLVISWLTSMSDDTLDKTLSILGSMTEYLSFENMLQILGYNNVDTFIHTSGLEEQDAETLIAAWEDSFIQANQANRDRILKTIYGNKNIGKLNTDLKGLAKFSSFKYNGSQMEESNIAMDIASIFNSNKIISKYADYFTTQLVDINDLAEEGYVQLASTRLTGLYDLATSISSIKDSSKQNDLFSIITKINFTSYDSIKTAMDEIETYVKNNNIEDITKDNELSSIYETLVSAVNNLVFNVNTLAQDVINTVTNASSKIDSIISANKAGITFDKALEEFSNLQASFPDLTNFNQVFSYDAVLGKYIYTKEGLVKAIEAQEQNLQTQIDQLTTTAEIYTQEIAVWDKQSQKFLSRRVLWGESNNVFKDVESFTSVIRTQIIQDDDSDQIKQAYESLAADYIKTTELDKRSWEDFNRYISERAAAAQDALDAALIVQQEGKNNKKNQYYQAIDWSALSLGTDYTGVNKELLKLLSAELGLEEGTGWSAVLDAYLKEIYKDNEAGYKAARKQLDEARISEEINKYQTAIAELLNYSANQYISDETNALMSNAGIQLDISNLKNNAQEAIDTAKAFLDGLADSIGTGAMTLETYNSQAKSILEATLANNGGKVGSLLNIAGGNINASSLESLANLFGKQLTDIVDVTTGLITGEALFGKISYNNLTNNYEIQGSFEEFISALEEQFGVIIDRTSKEYKDAIKKFNEARISDHKAETQRITDQFKALEEAKGGDWLDFSSITTQFTDETNKLLAEKLGQANASLEDGLLKLDPTANIIQVAEILEQAAKEAGAEGNVAVEQLQDSLRKVIDSYIQAIKNGINGTLNSTQKLDLENKATSLGITNLSFEQTVKGFKLAQDSAIELYYKIKQIDALQGELLFTELNKSLQEANTNYKNISDIANRIAWIEDKEHPERAQQYAQELALAKEIYAVRSTTEDSSFNFMSNKIPGGQNNPINYYNNWATAIQKLNEAFKTSSKTADGKTHKGLIDYQDWYNIVTEMNNLAALGEPIETGAGKLDGSMEAAAALIAKGAAALTATDTGDIKVSLGDIGVQFKAGSGEMSDGIQTGIKELAQSQIDMLDSVIAVLEAVVAMQDLGNLAGADGDAGTISINDLFPEIKFDDQGKYESGGDQINAAYETWRTELLKKLQAKTKDGKDWLNKDLHNFATSIEIDGQTFESILGLSPEKLAQKGKDFLTQYTAVLDALYKASQSDTYDLDNLVQSIRENLAGSGFTGTMPIGENLKLVFKDGISFVHDEKENKYTFNGQTFTDENAVFQAAALQTVEGLEGMAKKYNPDDGKATFTYDNFTITTECNIKNNEYKATFSDGGVVTSNSAEGLSLAIKHYAAMQNLDFSNGEGAETEASEGKVLEYHITRKGHVTIDVEADTKTGKLNFGNESDMSTNQDWVKEVQSAAEANPIKVNIETGENKVEEQVEANQKKGEDNPVTQPILPEDSVQAQIDANVTYGKKRPVIQEVRREYTDTGGYNEDRKPTLSKKKDNFTNAMQGDPRYNRVIEEEIKTNSDHTNQTAHDETAFLKRNLPSSIAQQATEAGIEVPQAHWMADFHMASEAVVESFKDFIIENIKKNGSFNLDSLTDEQTAVLAKAYSEVGIPEYSGEGLNKDNILNKTAAFRDALLQDIRISNPEITSDQIIPATVEVDDNGTIDEVQEEINQIKGTTTYVDVYERFHESPHINNANKPNSNQSTQSIGNLGLAKAAGTLMGELGPELVVSNGRYFVAGQNGPEMVDLAKDAIVFNHLQTKSLLEKGMSTGRGKAVTNERNAVAFATGSVHGGPAMADAASALNALKQLRAQWQALLNLSVQDLASNAGGGGGGGNKAFLKDVERWYNWLQRIAELESQINYYEKERARINSDYRSDGYAYYASQKKSLEALQEEIALQQNLAESQQAYMDKRRKEMNSANNPFSKFYTFDENGQLKYTDNTFKYNGKTYQGGLAALAEINATDTYGNKVHSTEEQMSMMKAWLGSDVVEKYRYSDTGEERSDAEVLEELWTKMSADQSEMQSLHDSIDSANEAVQDLLDKQNQLLKDMRDNQMDVEQKIYNTIVDMKQRVIDDLEDTKDAISDANSKFIEGLSNALSKEQEQYERAQSQEDLDKLRAQRDVLVRSGGSAAEIANLNDQIEDQEQSLYFDKQQEQIDAIQEASDKQIEKLEAEINTLNEILEYQKKYGLLWAQVTEIMTESPKQIADFIAINNSEYWDKSPVASAEAMNELLFGAEKWASYRDDTMVDDLKAIAAALTGSNENSESGNGSNNGSENGSDNGGNGSNNGSNQGSNNQAKTKWSASVSYKMPDKSTDTATGTGIDTSEDTAKSIAKSYALKKVPKDAISIQNTTYRKIYKTGGYDYETGLVQLDGTKSRPEAVLNATQTQILRDNILSNKPNSVINLLKSYNEAYKGLSSGAYDSITTNNSGTNINKAEVNLNIDSMDSDYDAKRAANTVMDEMLRIASKTKANNSIRR